MNLKSKVCDGDAICEMFDRLSEIVHSSPPPAPPGGVDHPLVIALLHVDGLVTSFCNDYGPLYPAFIEYFLRTWVPQLHMVALSFRRGVMVAGQTGTQICEGYHSALKFSPGYGLSGRRISGRRPDWLLYQLLFRVVPLFVTKFQASEAGRTRNTRGEKAACLAVRLARWVGHHHHHHHHVVVVTQGCKRCTVEEFPLCLGPTLSLPCIVACHVLSVT